MKSILWVMGASAVGKKTIIKKIIDSLSVDDLDLYLNNPVVYRKSLQRRYGKSLTVDNILDFLRSNNCVLVKMQWTEIYNNIPIKLLKVINKEFNSQVSYKIICLVADINVLSLRRKLYRKWMSFDTKECWKEQKAMIDCAMKYEQEGIEIVFIDSTDGYTIIDKKYLYNFLIL